MSVVWIKVNRKKKIHSIYCDGIQKAGDDIIAGNNSKKIRRYNFFRTSVLMGVVGASHGAGYIKKYFPIKWKTSNIQYDKEDCCAELSEFFENMANEYKEKYDQPLDNDLILSINGMLFWVSSVNDGKIWQVGRSSENFICAGTPTREIKALLYYNENMNPQKILNTLVKVQSTINTNLFKIENISYEQ